MAIADCHLIEFPKIHDPRGNLSFIESHKHVPFEIKRIYYLYDVPDGATRAGHAHKALEQVLVAIGGSFDVLLDDGKDRKRVHLDCSYFGLYIHPLTWRVIENFAYGTTCLAIVSDFYDESDYYRDYGEFLRAIGAQK